MPPQFSKQTTTPPLFSIVLTILSKTPPNGQPVIRIRLALLSIGLLSPLYSFLIL